MDTDKKYHIVTSCFLAFILLIGLILRLHEINQSIRYDEANTYMYYIHKGISYFWTHYEAPNNHIGHNILATPLSNLFPYQEWVLRLPALVMGMACIFLSFKVACLYVSPLAGLFAATLTAVSPLLILYSTNARGYSLVGAFTLLGIWMLEKWHQNRSDKMAASIYVISQVYGMFTIPTMLYSSAALALFSFIKSIRIYIKEKNLSALGSFFILHILIAIGVILLYLPLVLNQGLDCLTGNSFVKALDWQNFNAALGPHLGKWFHQWSHDIHPYIFWVSCLLAIVSFFTNKGHRRKQLILFACILTSIVAITFAKRVVPFTRTWLCFYPLIFVFASGGFSWILKQISCFKWRYTLVALTVIVSLLTSLKSLRDNPVTQMRETGIFIGGREALNYLIENHYDAYPLIAGPYAQPIIHYYQRKYDVRFNEEITDPSYTCVIVQKEHGETLLKNLFIAGKCINKLPDPVYSTEFTEIYRIPQKDLLEHDFHVQHIEAFAQNKAQSPWYGTFSYVRYPWIDHSQHGWQQYLTQAPGSLWIYDRELRECIRINPETYPRMQLGEDPGILVDWDPSTKTPHRRFTRVDTQEVIQEETYIPQKEISEQQKKQELLAQKKLIEAYFPDAIIGELKTAHSPWYGDFHFYYYPWIEHKQHGWQQCVGGKDDSLWFFDKALDEYIWINPERYPEMRFGKDQGLAVKWDPQTSTPNRRFTRLDNGEIIREEDYSQRVKAEKENVEE